MNNLFKIFQLFLRLFGIKKPKQQLSKKTIKEVVDEAIEEATEKPTYKQKYLWCLDNGHGKLQDGKRSALFEYEGKEIQFFEWEFNRDIVVRIVKQLKELGIAYFEVAPYPREMSSDLSYRVQRTKQVETDLKKVFLSIHANGWTPNKKIKWSNVSGIETWIGGNTKRFSSYYFAKTFNSTIVRATGWKDRGVKRTVDYDIVIRVLDKADCIAVLTENGFFTNKDQVKELMKDSVRQKIANAHVAAIMEIEGVFR